MARPRFGPQAPRTSPGFTPVGTPPPPRALPSGGSAPLFRPSPPTNVENLTGRFAPSPRPALTEDQRYISTIVENPTLRAIGERYDRPQSTLGAIFRTLRLGENVGVGSVKGVSQAISQAVKFDGKGFGGLGKDLLEALPPWAFVVAANKGYAEMAKAVRDDLTYEEWIAQSNNPDSFLFRHSKPIGIALSIFGDPTTYVTFGSTGVSKSVAQAALATSWKSTYDEAIEAVSSGAMRGNLDQIAVKIHLDAGRPFTQGDAFNQLRQFDRAKMGFGQGRGLNVRGNLRGAFARGGQGVNLMGQQILPPGIYRRARPEVLSQARMAERFSGVVPDHKLLQIADDARRFVAMHEFARIAQKSANLGEEAVQQSLRIFEVDPAAAQALQSAPSHIKRAELAVRNVFNGRVPYVPVPDRRGLLREGYTPKGAYADRLKMMQVSAKGVRTTMKKQLAAAGFDDQMLKNTDALWDKLVREFDDPIEVISRFQMHAAAKLHSARAMDELLKNPMFARIAMDDIEAAFTKAFDDYNTLGDRLFDARKSLRAAKTSQQKAARTRVVRDLEGRYATAKATYETAKETRKLEVGKAGARVVSSSEAWGRAIKETTIPVRWRGTKYHVPQPIADAIGEMRNPSYIDTELKRSFRAMNWTQNKWKVLATSVNPAFHVMNLVGGMWNNMLGGIYNPADYVQTMVDVYRHRAAESGGMGLWQTLRPMGEEQAAQVKELVGAFESRRVGGGLVREELGQRMRDVIGPTSQRGLGRRAFTAARRTYGAVSAATLIAPDEWVPDEVEALTMGGLGVALLAPEFMRAGSIVANDVEEALRMTPMRVAQKDKSYAQMMEAWSINPPANFGKWMDQTDLAGVDMAKEFAWDIGASLALRFQFDYSKLTWTERYVAKTIFPFYTFYKNNFVLQVVENAKRPRFLNAFEGVANYSESLAEGEDNNPHFRELLPEYFDKLAMFQIPVPGGIREVLGLPQDQPLFLNPKLPFASLNLFPPLWQLANDNDVQPTQMKVLGMLAPFFGSVGPFAVGGPFKPLLEYSVGYQLGLARPIDFQRFQSGGWRESNVPVPGYVGLLPGPIKDWFGVFKDPNTGQEKMNASLRYLTDQLASPFITGLGEPLAVSAGGEHEKARANTLAWMTGIRMTPVDPLRIQRGWLYRMENYLEGQRGELRERGFDLTTEDANFLRELRAQIRVVERAWDEKQEELYGQP